MGFDPHCEKIEAKIFILTRNDILLTGFTRAKLLLQTTSTFIEPTVVSVSEQIYEFSTANSPSKNHNKKSHIATNKCLSDLIFLEKFCSLARQMEIL